MAASSRARTSGHWAREERQGGRKPLSAGEDRTAAGAMEKPLNHFLVLSCNSE